MTAIAHERAPPQPQSKALATVQSYHPEITANNVGQLSPALSRANKPDAPKSRPGTTPPDFTSNSATLSMIRRTLIPSTTSSKEPRSSPKPVADILPPLTSSNEVDIQLYAIVAIILKDLVNTWYSKITPDRVFTDEIVHIIAHCSRGLEQRIRRVDIAELILDEIPVLIENHINAYRIATTSSAEHVYGYQAQIVYHSLNPHPALDPVVESGNLQAEAEQAQNEKAYRQLLINGALAILLPIEDLQNAPLRILVSDVIADLIIGQVVAGKVCEGWFLHEAIIKIATILESRIEPKKTGQELRHVTKTRLEQFGLLAAMNESKPAQSRQTQPTLALWFWRITQWIYLAIMFVWSTAQGILHARHLPKRTRLSPSSDGSAKMLASAPNISKNDLSPQPVLAYEISNVISTLFRLSDRMPWLASTMLFWKHVLLDGSGRLAASNSVLDRFLHHTLETRVFTPNLVSGILLNMRAAVFPNNALGPAAPPPPSPEEKAEIRHRAAKSILKLFPSIIAQQLWATEEMEEIVEQIEEDILDVFGDRNMNKHLVYSILELILVRLIPELGNTGTGELLIDRAIAFGDQ